MTELYSVCVETPVGPAALRYQTSPFRLMALDLEPAGHQAVWHRGTADAGRELEAICRLIRLYGQGQAIAPPWPLLSMGHLTALQQKVLYETAQIPYASLKTYKKVAEAIARPKAYRFVGSALGKNPFPIIIPCHRVVRQDGKTGNFSAGPDIKQRLIDFESGRS